MQVMPDSWRKANVMRGGRTEKRMGTHFEFLELSALVPAAFPLFFHALDGGETRIRILWP